MNNEAEIRQLIEKWAQAVKDRDIDGIMAHHAPEMVMYDVPPPFQSLGLAAYRSTWDTFFKYSKPGIFDFQSLQIVAGEQVAFCYAAMKCSDSSDTGSFIELPFRLTVGLKKVDGQWLIVHEHHSIPAG